MDQLQGDRLTAQESSTNWIVRPDPDLADLIPAFLQNRKTELDDFKLAVARKDYEFIRRLAHTWKGICRPYGFIHLETLSFSLEAAGEREDPAEVNQVVNEITSHLEKVSIV